MSFTLKLRPYQDDAVKAVHDYFALETGNPLVVAPTASGKSVMIAALIQSFFEQNSRTRCLLLSHVKELLTQDYNKIKAIWPDCPVGLYSAGLNKRETIFPITVAGIQSVYKKPELFHWIDYLIIDEAHLLSFENDTMYRRLIHQLLKYNPNMKVIGFTATPFRLKGGLLTTGETRIFTDICFEISIDYLIGKNLEKKQYIANLISKSSKTQADLTGVKTTGGDYNQKQAADVMDDDELTEAALNEVFKYAEAENRRSILFFCTSIEHAINVRDAVRRRGYECETVNKDTSSTDRATILKNFVEKRLMCLTSMGVLTTGFDAPGITLIALLRATQSLGLYIQMLGRGMRLDGATIEESIANGKENCLVLDFAGNMSRHGPINCIDYKLIDQKIRFVICDMCQAPNSESALTCYQCGFQLREEILEEEDEEKFLECPNCGFGENPEDSECCLECGYLFPQEKRRRIYGGEAHEGVILADTKPGTWKEEVTNVIYSIHYKPGKPDSLRVDYHIGSFLDVTSEWVLVGHDGYARTKAVQWWGERTKFGVIPPRTAQEALQRTVELKTPKVIEVKMDGKFKKVVKVLEWQDPCVDLYNKAMKIYRNHPQFIQIREWAEQAVAEERKDDLIQLILEAEQYVETA
jgi:DNA repair protein RadD